MKFITESDRVPKVDPHSALASLANHAVVLADDVRKLREDVVNLRANLPVPTPVDFHEALVEADRAVGALKAFARTLLGAGIVLLFVACGGVSGTPWPDAGGSGSEAGDPEAGAEAMRPQIEKPTKATPEDGGAPEAPLSEAPPALACDPITNEGCAALLRCGYECKTGFACMAAGPQKEGQACTASSVETISDGPCAAGLACVSGVRCWRYCRKDSDCAAPAYCQPFEKLAVSCVTRADLGLGFCAAT
jgi:hypothetical protein